MNKVCSYGFSEFPAGLKVLIVDDDRTCLLVLEKMLQKLLYQVTKCQLAREALALLRHDKNRFDIVICDLHMPDMDGFKLLRIIELEMDLPVVLMSSDDEKGVVMKGIAQGACDYLVKPVRMETVRLIWQHVVRKRKRILGEFQQPAGHININVNDRLLLLEQAKDAAAANQMPDKRSLQILKRRREDEHNNGEYSNEVTNRKKPRVIWTPKLHDTFFAALNQLGRENAVPKKILERMQAMNITATGLTRANIGSHLQKYRLRLQKEAARSRTDKKDLNVNFEQASSFDQRYQQILPTTTSSQLPLQNIVSSQPWSFERENENVLSTAPSNHDQGIDIFDSNIVSEWSLCLPTDFSWYDPLAITNEECLYKKVGNVAELSNPLPAVDELIYEPSFSVEQYIQEDFFYGPF